MSEPQEPDELNLSSDQSQTDPAKQNAFNEDGKDFHYKLSDFYNVRASTLSFLQRNHFHNNLFYFCNVRASSIKLSFGFFFKNLVRTLMYGVETEYVLEKKPFNGK